MDGTGLLSCGAASALLRHGVDVESVSYPPEVALGYGELERLVRHRLEVTNPQILIAESFSGPLAIRLVSRLRRRLCALVLVATFARPPAFSTLRFVPRALFSQSPPRWAIRKFMLGQDAPSKLVTEVKYAIDQVHSRVLHARLVQVLTTNVEAELDAIRVPTLYLRPTRDRLVRRPLVAPSEHIVVEHIDGPHLILQRHPELCAEHITRFIRSV